MNRQSCHSVRCNLSLASYSHYWGGIRQSTRRIRANRFHFSTNRARSKSSLSFVNSLSTDMALATEIETPGMEQQASLLSDFASIPSISAVWAFDGYRGVRVSMELTQKDLPGNMQRRFMSQFQLDDQTLKGGQVDISLPLEIKDAIFISPSPSGSKMIVVKEGETEKSSAVVQVWNRLSMEYELVVPEKMHGSVMNDGWFGSRASWSADEAFVAYVAEVPVASSTPEWGSSPDKAAKEESTIAKPKSWKGIGKFEEDWGEGKTGKRPSSIFVLDIKEQSIEAVGNLPGMSSYGQPVWSKEGFLVFVAWDHSSTNFPLLSRRLGITFCFNRPCRLLALDWSKDRYKPVNLHSKLKSSFSPVFCPDGRMIFLSQDNAVKTGVHSATPCLYGTTLESLLSCLAGDSTEIEAKCIIDTKCVECSGVKFPGFYCTTIKENFVVLDGKSMLLTTVQWRSNLAVIGIDLETGQVTRLTPDNNASWTILACKGDFAIFSESYPTCPCRIYAATMKAVNAAPVLVPLDIPDFKLLPKTVAKALNDLEHCTLEVMASDAEKNPVSSFEITVIHNKKARPTIFIPHGGPHTAYSSQFIMPISFLAAVGYNVVTINYRGSTGFGEDFLQSLPGKIGDADVRDCISAVESAKKAGFVLEDKVAVIGGSHGSFISAHLIGQYPDIFKAAVMRNPVCDISLMIHQTDIPDWCFIETFGITDGMKKAQSCVTESDLVDMFQKSPVRYISKVKTPVLMMLGGADRRVPMDDGKRYISRLQQSSPDIDTRVIVFPKDSHGLTNPQTEFEQWITALWWLKVHDVV